MDQAKLNSLCVLSYEADGLSRRQKIVRILEIKKIQVKGRRNAESNKILSEVVGKDM